jgi:hypothetical protein
MDMQIFNPNWELQSLEVYTALKTDWDKKNKEEEEEEKKKSKKPNRCLL